MLNYCAENCTNNTNASVAMHIEGGISRALHRRLLVIAGGVLGMLLLCMTLMTATAPRSHASDFVSIARQAAVKANISPDLFVRQIRQESGFNPNATSWVGAQGIAQFMPGTAAEMGVNPHDPVASLYAAARLMAINAHMFGGDYAKGLAAYNAGPGAVQRAVRIGGGAWLRYMPGETQHYVHTIMG
jgi:soluble lytic murein transglycosylase-like protein